MLHVLLRSRLPRLVVAFLAMTAGTLAVPATASHAQAAGPWTDLGDISGSTLDAIDCVSATEVMFGTSDTEFSPRRYVTRIEMAQFLSRALTMVAPPSRSMRDPGFEDLGDVSAGARAAVTHLWNTGITRGTSTTEFSPADNVSRRQMALFLTRLLKAAGIEPATGFVAGFEDTRDQNAEVRAAIAQLRVQGITQGTSLTHFSPRGKVTRAQMARFLTRTLAVMQSDSSFEVDSNCTAPFRAHQAVQRPLTVRLSAERSTLQVGDSVAVEARLNGADGGPSRGLEVRLARGDEALTEFKRTGRDGSVEFVLQSTATFPATDNISVQVRVGSAVLTSEAVQIRWTRPSINSIDLSLEPIAVVTFTAERRPATGTSLEVLAAVTNEAGIPLTGARLELLIDGVSEGTATAGGDGWARFNYRGPNGPANEGGYDSLQSRLVGTDATSRPVGVFWQRAEPRRISVTISPDAAHSAAPRTITATASNGSAAIKSQMLELRIDGTTVARARTDSAGVASFRRSGPLHGPFDLAEVVLADDPSVASNEVLFSWPMAARGSASGNGWNLAWSDEFEGTSLDTSRWVASTNCPPVYLACDTDRQENVEVADGRLRLRTLRETYSGINQWRDAGNQYGPVTTYTPGRYQTKAFTSGRVETTGLQSFTYGRFEILARLPQGHGTFFAIWMQPDDSPYGRGASAGEIDIAEGANIGTENLYGVDAQIRGPGWGIHHVVHMGQPFTNPFSLTNLDVNPAESFHLYAVEWDTASIRFYIDESRVLTVPVSDWFSHPSGQAAPVNNPYAPFDVPFNLIINNTVGNWATESLPGHQVPDSTVFPATLEVEYVRAYQCRPPSGAGGPGQGCETR